LFLSRPMRALVACLSPLAFRPQEASLAMLLPRDAGSRPAHSVPEGLARIVFCKESSESDPNRNVGHRPASVTLPVLSRARLHWPSDPGRIMILCLQAGLGLVSAASMPFDPDGDIIYVTQTYRVKGGPI
jgi:hypothetical protein